MLITSSSNTANRVIKNTGILYVKMGITTFISLYITRLILGSLGVTDFGIFSVVGGVISMLSFLNTAMAAATQRFMSFAEGEGNKKKQKQIFNISVILHLGIAMIIAIVLELFGLILFKSVLNIPEERIYTAQIIYQFMILSTMFTVITVPYDAVVNANENMYYYAIVGIIESLLKLIVALIVVYTLFDKLIIYGALMAFISLIIMIIMRVYCHRKYDECSFAPRLYFDKKLMIEMTSFAGWSFLGSSTSMIGNYGLGIVLNNFFGTILNASLGIAVQLNGQLGVFSNTIMKALNPAIVKSEGSGEREDMLKMSLIGCKFSVFLFSFFAIPFLIETPYILNLWLTKVPDWTVVFCRFAIVRSLLEQLTISLGTSIGAHGKIKYFNIVKSTLNIFPLPLVYISFLYGGPPYMIFAIPIVIWGVIESVVTIYFTMRYCNLKLNDYFDLVLFKVLQVFTYTLTLSLIPIYIMEDTFARLAIVTFISTLTFFASVFIVGLSKVEKSYLYIGINSFLQRKNNS